MVKPDLAGGTCLFAGVAYHATRVWTTKNQAAHMGLLKNPGYGPAIAGSECGAILPLVLRNLPLRLTLSSGSSTPLVAGSAVSPLSSP